MSVSRVVSFINLTQFRDLLLLRRCSAWDLFPCCVLQEEKKYGKKYIGCSFTFALRWAKWRLCSVCHRLRWAATVAHTKEGTEGMRRVGSSPYPDLMLAGLWVCKDPDKDNGCWWDILLSEDLWSVGLASCKYISYLIIFLCVFWFPFPLFSNSTICLLKCEILYSSQPERLSLFLLVLKVLYGDFSSMICFLSVAYFNPLLKIWDQIVTIQVFGSQLQNHPWSQCISWFVVDSMPHYIYPK